MCSCAVSRACACKCMVMPCQPLATCMPLRTWSGEGHPPCAPSSFNESFTPQPYVNRVSTRQNVSGAQDLALLPILAMYQTTACLSQRQAPPSNSPEGACCRLRVRRATDRPEVLVPGPGLQRPTPPKPPRFAPSVAADVGFTELHPMAGCHHR